MIDFVVIGGGVAGLSAGAHLSAHGTVLLLEAERDLGYHASGRSAALFEPNYGSAPVRALSLAGEAYLRGGGYLSPRGFMLLGTDADTALFEADLSGLGCSEISVTEACAKVPILDPGKLSRAAYHAGAEDIDTDRLLQDFARKIRANGGTLETGAQVKGLHKDGATWLVRTETGDHSARMVVNAAGPWADEVARMAGIAPKQLQPLRRSMARIAAPGGHDVSRWPMFFGAGERWYAKPDAGQLIVSPADEDPMPPMDAWPDDMVLAEGLARYQDMVTQPLTRPTATWAGLRTFAPDKSLVLGPDPADPTFVWSAAQGGYGFQTGPAAGALVACLAIGDKADYDADILARLDPGRF